LLLLQASAVRQGHTGPLLVAGNRGIHHHGRRHGAGRGTQQSSWVNASHEATLFTDDLAKLGPQLGAEVSKTSALEINQNFIDRAGNWHAALIGIFHLILLPDILKYINVYL
jgi:hypothetical protein